MRTTSSPLEVTANVPPIQRTIEQAVGALLPYAAKNLMLPFHTPLRWHESRMQGALEPFSFALWVCLDPGRLRTITINRTLPSDHENPNGLWSSAVEEPTPLTEDEADRARYGLTGLEYPEGPAHRTVSVGVDKSGEVTVQVSRFRKAGPTQHDTCTSVEINTGMPSERRAELLGHVGEMLTLAAAQSPQDQLAFFAGHGLDLSSRSFERLASPVSRKDLGPVLAANPAAA